MHPRLEFRVLAALCIGISQGVPSYGIPPGNYPVKRSKFAIWDSGGQFPRNYHKVATKKIAEIVRLWKKADRDFRLCNPGELVEIFTEHKSDCQDKRQPLRIPGNSEILTFDQVKVLLNNQNEEKTLLVIETDGTNRESVDTPQFKSFIDSLHYGRVLVIDPQITGIRVVIDTFEGSKQDRKIDK